jgi:hypothetical protein
MNVEGGRERSSDVEVTCGRSVTLAEGGSRNESNAEMQVRDSRFDTSLSSFELASGAEMKRFLKSAWAWEHQRTQKGRRQDWLLLGQLSTVVQNDQKEDILELFRMKELSRTNPIISKSSAYLDFGLFSE